MKERVLVIGSSGQIGCDLVLELRKLYGNSNVIASDIRKPSNEIMESGPFENLDVLDSTSLRRIVGKYKISQVYLLAALLSATAEKNIELGWRLNMRSHSHVLDLARDGLIKKVFWPSSIAVFGPNTPKKIHHNIQSWSLTLFMESQNLPVKDGTNIIQKNLMSILEVLDILA